MYNNITNNTFTNNDSVSMKSVYQECTTHDINMDELNDGHHVLRDDVHKDDDYNKEEVITRSNSDVSLFAMCSTDPL